MFTPGEVHGNCYSRSAESSRPVIEIVKIAPGRFSEHGVVFIARGHHALI